MRASTPSDFRMRDSRARSLQNAPANNSTKSILFDEHRYLRDAEKMQQVTMTARIFLDAFLRIDQQQRRFQRSPRR